MNYIDLNNWPFKNKDMTFVFIGSFIFEDNIHQARPGYVHSHYEPKHILRLIYNHSRFTFHQTARFLTKRKMEFTHKWYS